MRKLPIFIAAMLAIGPLTANADLIKLEASIDGAQANAGLGSGSASMAFADMSYDTVTMMLTWVIDEVTPFFDSDVVFAHFHGAATPIQNAAVQVLICTNISAGPACGGSGDPFAIGSSVLSGAQADDLLAGLWYVNIHTRAFLPGEIRGQVQGVRVPEPGTLALLVIGLAGLGLTRRRRTA